MVPLLQTHLLTQQQTLQPGHGHPSVQARPSSHTLEALVRPLVVRCLVSQLLKPRLTCLLGAGGGCRGITCLIAGSSAAPTLGR